VIDTLLTEKARQQRLSRWQTIARYHQPNDVYVEQLPGDRLLMRLRSDEQERLTDMVWLTDTTVQRAAWDCSFSIPSPMDPSGLRLFKLGGQRSPFEASVRHVLAWSSWSTETLLEQPVRVQKQCAACLSFMPPSGWLARYSYQPRPPYRLNVFGYLEDIGYASYAAASSAAQQLASRHGRNVLIVDGHTDQIRAVQEFSYAQT